MHLIQSIPGGGVRRLLNLAPIHHRIPVILAPEDEDHWLNPDGTEPARLKPLLNPYPAHLIVATRVSLKVNNPTNDTKEIIEPITP